jgi:hypothetical protein
MKSLCKPAETANITTPTSRVSGSETTAAKMTHTVNRVTGFSSEANGISGVIAAIIIDWQESETTSQQVERC